MRPQKGDRNQATPTGENIVMELALLIAVMTVVVLVGAGCIWLFRGWLKDREHIMKRFRQD